MNEILKGIHSGWRYVVLVLLVLAIINAVTGWLSNKPYTASNKKLNLFTLIAAHLQLLGGLAVYFVNGWYKVDSSMAMGRYWKMEHVGLMVLAIVLITVGNAKSKKAITDVAKHKTIAIFFGLALLIIALSIFTMVKSDPSRSYFGVS